MNDNHDFENSQLFDDNFNMMSQTSNYSSNPGCEANKENPTVPNQMENTSFGRNNFSSFEYKTFDCIPSFTDNLFLG